MRKAQQSSRTRQKFNQLTNVRMVPLETNVVDEMVADELGISPRRSKRTKLRRAESPYMLVTDKQMAEAKQRVEEYEEGRKKRGTKAPLRGNRSASEEIGVAEKIGISTQFDLEFDPIDGQLKMRSGPKSVPCPMFHRKVMGTKVGRTPMDIQQALDILKKTNTQTRSGEERLRTECYDAMLEMYKNKMAFQYDIIDPYREGGTLEPTGIHMTSAQYKKNQAEQDLSSETGPSMGLLGLVMVFAKKRKEHFWVDAVHVVETLCQELNMSMREFLERRFLLCKTTARQGRNDRSFDAEDRRLFVKNKLEYRKNNPLLLKSQMENGTDDIYRKFSTQINLLYLYLTDINLLRHYNKKDDSWLMRIPLEQSLVQKLMTYVLHVHMALGAVRFVFQACEPFCNWNPTEKGYSKDDKDEHFELLFNLTDKLFCDCADQKTVAHTLFNISCRFHNESDAVNQKSQCVGWMREPGTFVNDSKQWSEQCDADQELENAELALMTLMMNKSKRMEQQPLYMTASEGWSLVRWQSVRMYRKYEKTADKKRQSSSKSVVSNCNKRYQQSFDKAYQSTGNRTCAEIIADESSRVQVITDEVSVDPTTKMNNSESIGDRSDDTGSKQTEEGDSTDEDDTNDTIEDDEEMGDDDSVVSTSTFDVSDKDALDSKAHASDLSITSVDTLNSYGDDSESNSVPMEPETNSKKKSLEIMSKMKMKSSRRTRTKRKKASLPTRNRSKKRSKVTKRSEKTVKKTVSAAAGMESGDNDDGSKMTPIYPNNDDIQSEEDEQQDGDGDINNSSDDNNDESQDINDESQDKCERKEGIENNDAASDDRSHDEDSGDNSHKTRPTCDETERGEKTKTTLSGDNLVVNIGNQKESICLTEDADTNDDASVEAKDKLFVGRRSGELREELEEETSDDKTSDDKRRRRSLILDLVQQKETMQSNMSAIAVAEYAMFLNEQTDNELIKEGAKLAAFAPRKRSSIIQQAVQLRLQKSRMDVNTRKTLPSHGWPRSGWNYDDYIKDDFVGQFKELKLADPKDVDIFSPTLAVHGETVQVRQRLPIIEAYICENLSRKEHGFKCQTSNSIDDITNIGVTNIASTVPEFSQPGHTVVRYIRQGKNYFPTDVEETLNDIDMSQIFDFVLNYKDSNGVPSVDPTREGTQEESQYNYRVEFGVAGNNYVERTEDEKRRGERGRLKQSLLGIKYFQQFKERHGEEGVTKVNKLSADIGKLFDILSYTSDTARKRYNHHHPHPFFPNKKRFEKFGARVRELLQAQVMRNEWCSIQLKCINRGDITDNHYDKNNCSWPGYNVTQTLCFVYEDQEGLLWSIKFIANSRQQAGNDTIPDFNVIRSALERQLRAIDNDMFWLYAHNPPDDFCEDDGINHSAKDFRNFFLHDNLPWTKEVIGSVNGLDIVLESLQVMSAIQRDFFLSSMISGIYDVRRYRKGADVDLLELGIVASYQNSGKRFYYLCHDTKHRKYKFRPDAEPQISNARDYYHAAIQKFGSFVGGTDNRCNSTGIDFEEIYLSDYEDKIDGVMATVKKYITELCEWINQRTFEADKDEDRSTKRTVITIREYRQKIEEVVAKLRSVKTSSGKTVEIGTFRLLLLLQILALSGVLLEPHPICTKLVFASRHTGAVMLMKEHVYNYQRRQRRKFQQEYMSTQDQSQFRNKASEEVYDDDQHIFLKERNYSPNDNPEGLIVPLSIMQRFIEDEIKLDDDFIDYSLETLSKTVDLNDFDRYGAMDCIGCESQVKRREGNVVDAFIRGQCLHTLRPDGRPVHKPYGTRTWIPLFGTYSKWTFNDDENELY